MLKNVCLTQIRRLKAYLPLTQLFEISIITKCKSVYLILSVRNTSCVFMCLGSSHAGVVTVLCGPGQGAKGDARSKLWGKMSADCVTMHHAKLFTSR